MNPAAVVAAVALGLFPGAPARAFTYPSRPALPPGEARVDENLFRTYYAERASDARLGDADRERARDARNRGVLAELARAPLAVASGGVARITRAQAVAVLDTVPAHPIAGGAGVARYDPDGGVGFCFGRAAYVHLELLRRGVAPGAVAKLFALGRFRHDGGLWDFHVTTIARGPGGTWWAIDPRLGRVTPVDDWMRETSRLEADPLRPRARFFVTDAVKFQPTLGAYNPRDLELPLFNGFFDDLGRWFDAHPVSASQRFP